MSRTRVLDANVILRYLLADHAAHYEAAAGFLNQVKSGDATAHVPEGALVECVYVLLKVYGVPRREVADKLAALLSYRGMVGDALACFAEALRLFGSRNVDIVDALVVTTARARDWEVFSFDRDLEKLKS
ncbi:PIN domain-containing protein [Thermithiobacillus plumbiphilus]|uniref:Ribonuclease VapC n=1 Tax=Thermithiobacillus plumbiphilus TaxID=1729899 RepID=A0ABU9D8A3_9PROT